MTSVLANLSKFQKAQKASLAVTESLSITKRILVALTILSAAAALTPAILSFVQNAVQGKKESALRIATKHPSVLLKIARFFGAPVLNPVKTLKILGSIAAAAALVYLVIHNLWPKGKDKDTFDTVVLVNHPNSSFVERQKLSLKLLFLADTLKTMKDKDLGFRYRSMVVPIRKHKNLTEQLVAFYRKYDMVPVLVEKI